MLDQQRRSAIDEAARQPPQQVDLAVHLAQQQRPAVAGNLTGGEPGLHAARKMSCKCERFLVTLCHQKGRLRTANTTSRQRSYAMKRRPFQALSKSPRPDLYLDCEKSGLSVHGPKKTGRSPFQRSAIGALRPRATVAPNGVKAFEESVFGPCTLGRTWGTRPGKRASFFAPSNSAVDELHLGSLLIGYPSHPTRALPTYMLHAIHRRGFGSVKP